MLTSFCSSSILFFSSTNAFFSARSFARSSIAEENWKVETNYKSNSHVGERERERERDDVKMKKKRMKKKHKIQQNIHNKCTYVEPRVFWNIYSDRKI